LLFLSAS